MNWLQYVGRVLLAIGVIAIAIWATANKLLDMPVRDFWIGILSYLLAAEVVWTLVERRSSRQDRNRPCRGCLKLARGERSGGTPPRWFEEGGRVRMADLLARRDSPREALAAVRTAVLARVSSPRLHLLTAPVGSGRSTLLLRLARALLEADQQVFLVLPAPELLALEQVLDAAKHRQVYLLVDDLDLRPEAEEWLYEFARRALPVVVIATNAPAAVAAGQGEGLDALRPVSLLSNAVTHDISVSHNDVVALSHQLGPGADRQRVGLTLQETDGLLATGRAFRGRDGGAGLWRDLDRGEDLPDGAKLMVALTGCAEMCFAECAWRELFGRGSLARWRRAGLVVADHGFVLPPHRLTCLDYLARPGLATAAADALEALCRGTLPTEPAFAARLLCALARQPQTRDLARRCLEQLGGAAAVQETWPEAVIRLWRRTLDALALLPGDTVSSGYPPELNMLVCSASARAEWPRALALARQLGADPVYRDAARFAAAVALARQGEAAAAEGELEGIRSGLVGVHYLRGVLAEMQGDALRALDAYEASRKADELQLSSTRSLAFAHVKCGAPRAAIPLFEALLGYHPHDAELYAGLAVAHLHAGMAQRAAAQSVRAIQAGVDPVVARKAVARACARAHAYARAVPELEACVSYDDTDPETWEALAEACRWLGRFSREEECLRRLREHEPDNEEFRLQMARCQRDQGRAEVAFDILQPLLGAQTPDLRALLLAAEVTGDSKGRALQQTLAQRAVALGDDSGWGQFWLGDSHAEADDAARAAYRTAIKQMQQQIEAGATPRHAATLWQAICLAASRLDDAGLATQAARRAGQEAAICEALGAEIHSVAHRQAVPPEVFLESLQPNSTGGSSPKPGVPEVPEKGSMKPLTAPTESSTLRNRRLRGAGN